MGGQEERGSGKGKVRERERGSGRGKVREREGQGDRERGSGREREGCISVATSVSIRNETKVNSQSNPVHNNSGEAVHVPR